MRLLRVLMVVGSVWSLPQTGTNLCGTNERGLPRQAGETWQEDCNRCRCTDNLLPGCTKRFCAPVPEKTSTVAPRGGEGGESVMFPGVVRGEPEPAPVQCTDKSGGAREVGEAWKEECNNCRCGSTGVPLCTQKFCGNPEPYCTDKSGQRREVGDSWKEDCNNCRCGSTGASLCTQRFCIDVEAFREDRYLFTVDSSKNTEEILQCKADGARNCRAVRLNPSLLSSPPSSQFLKLLSGSDVELQVLRGPADLSSPTLNYQFSLTDGGDGSLTYRQSTSAAIGSFRPTTGSVHYTVESCGDGCNVIYERDSDYFNQFQD